MAINSVTSLSGKLARLFSLALLAAVAGKAWAQPANTLLMERWDGITGDTVPNLTGNANYPDNPVVRAYPASFEIPTNVADNYGTRTRGYLTPPATGNYTFWIAGDDNCELWLGTNDQPSTIRRIAYVPDWTNSREWGKYAQQQSAPIALTAGVRYYVETRHKEGTGGDNMAVGWQGPGITGDAERPIPGSRLAPYVLTAPAAKTVLLERWDGISGTAVANLTSNANYPANPSVRTYPTSYEIPSNVADNYGTRTRGYVTPPTTGNYTFWIASDDNSELWLGTNDQPSTIRLIASVPEWTNAREWTKFTQQQSAVIALTAGVRYYIETRHKEGTGGDHLAVGWQGPGITGDAERPIPGSRLTPPAAGEPPAITSQPANATVNAGQTAVFTVTATGTAPLTYQWRRNGTSIPGANAATYTTPAATAADNGVQFSVVVGNAAGSVTSANAVLTVISAPAIATQPANATVNQGQTAVFSVTATGSAPLTYQWSRNGTSIPGANAATYTTPAATAADNGALFAVVVGNAAGTVTSANAVLTVISAPTITSQPANASVNVGQTAAFSVTATGSAPLTYQWRRNGANIPGANAPAYTTPAVTNADNGVQFSVVVGNAAGSVTSANAVLTVTAAPTIVTQPANATVILGQAAQFTVVASGSAPLAYQWRRNGVSIGGATSASYTTPPTTSADNGALFSVVVSNSEGSVISGNAQLQVVTPPSIVTQPVNATVNSGQTATFSVTAAGTSLAYQWRRNGVAISGANASSYTTAATVPADNGAQFSVVVSNSAGSVTSSSAVLIVVFTMPNNRKVAISGELVDAAGNPLGFPTPVTVDAIVTLLDAATGGSNRYTEEFRAANGRGIRVENGLFVARLGEGVTTQNLQQVLTANPSLWAEITIDDGTPDILAPRTPITAAAYAVGGVPAVAAAATVLSGAGDPNALQVDAAVGTSYVNTLDNTTWFKLTTSWKLMD